MGGLTGADAVSRGAERETGDFLETDRMEPK